MDAENQQAESIMETYRRHPREGFRRLYAEFAPRLKAYLVSSFGLGSQESEDVIHDALLPWVEDPARMGAVDNPTAYLFASVRNGFRLLKRRKVDLPGDLEPVAPTLPDPAVGLDIQRALAKLPEEQREAVVLRVWGGLSLAETAEQQGVPLQTVASRYRYGMARLKEILSWIE